MAYLASIIYDGTNESIERKKAVHSISGDVYIIKPGNIMESLASHKVLFPESTAITIETAATYHMAYLAELAEKRAAAAAEAAENNLGDEDLN